MEFYGFDRAYLTPDPVKDAPEVFCVTERRKNFDEEAGYLSQGIKAGRPMKMLYNGIFGIGKTHISSYVSSRIKVELGDPISTVYVICPSMHRRSSFMNLYQAMMSRLGRELIDEFRERKAEELASLLLLDSRFMGQKGALPISPPLKYLMGEKLSQDEMKQLQAPSPQIGAREAVEILLMLGRFFLEQGKKLLIILDEMEKAEELRGDSSIELRDSLRNLFDITCPISFIINHTLRGIEVQTGPRLFQEPELRRRLEMRKIREYQNQELIILMKDIMKFRRDPEFPLSSAVERLGKTPEEVDETTYPFSAEALRKIVELLEDEVREKKIDGLRPAEAFHHMDNLLLHASRKQMPVIYSYDVAELSRPL